MDAPARSPLLIAALIGAVALSVSQGEPIEGGARRPSRVDSGLVLDASGGGEIRPFHCLPDAGKAAVVLFITTDCPIANRYAPELERIRRDYAARGVTLALLYVDPELTDEAAMEHAREYGLEAAQAVDRKHLAVRAAGATVTPEAVVVDPAGRVRYRGRIDDQFADYGARRTEPSRRDLREALDDLLAGREIAVPETAALGCHIPELVLRRDAGASEATDR
jgi:hypothetical protein